MELIDTDKVLECIQDVKDAAQSIAQFKDRTVFIYDENDLADKIKGVQKFPALGLVYEGMRAVGPTSATQGATAKMGSSVELVISLMVVSQPETMFNADTKSPTILYLSALRRMMLDRRSPAGHYWRFIVEAQAKPSKGLTFWVQRWSTPLQLQHEQRR